MRAKRFTPLISSRPVIIWTSRLASRRSQPAPTSALHAEPLPTDEAELFAKVVPEAYRTFLMYSREKRLRTCLSSRVDHEIHI